jgi:hypothetical protein
MASTKRVRFVKDIAGATEAGVGLYYAAGEVADIDREQAKAWIRSGIAIPAGPEEATLDPIEMAEMPWLGRPQ